MSATDSLTELEAVNYMLISAGEQPVAALGTADQGTDTVTAQFILNDVVTKEFQERGLDENVYETIIAAAGDNTVSLPLGTIDVYLRDLLEVTDSSGENKGQMNVTVRDGKLFNVTSQTNDFSAYTSKVTGQGGFRLVVKVYLPFTSLNVATRRMIMEESARRYQMLTQGASNVDAMLSGRAQLSRAQGRSNDTNNKGRNLFDGSDYNRFFAVNRTFFPKYGSHLSDYVRRG
jgi:hypothetical protein